MSNINNDKFLKLENLLKTVDYFKEKDIERILEGINKKVLKTQDIDLLITELERIKSRISKKEEIQKEKVKHRKEISEDDLEEAPNALEFIRPKIPGIKYYMYNILAHNVGYWLCNGCIINLLNTLKKDELFEAKKKKEKKPKSKIEKISEKIPEVIKNLQYSNFLNIQKDITLVCIKGEHGTNIHYCLKEIPDKIKIKDISKVRNKITKIYNNIDELYGISRKSEDLEVDHRTPKVIMNKEEVRGHDWVVEQLENLGEGDIEKVRNFWEPEPKNINLERPVYNQIYGSNDDKLEVNQWEAISMGVFRYFQLLTGWDNRRKSKDCYHCQHPKQDYIEKIRAFPLGMKFFFDGDEYFNEEGERCKGCVWYSPLLWWTGLENQIYEKYKNLEKIWEEWTKKDEENLKKIK